MKDEISLVITSDILHAFGYTSKENWEEAKKVSSDMRIVLERIEAELLKALNRRLAC